MRFARCGCCCPEPEPRPKAAATIFSAELCVTSVFSVLRKTLRPPGLPNRLGMGMRFVAANGCP